MTDAELDDLIDAWHFDNAGEGMELWEFLGWTQEEYSRWATTGVKPNVEG